MAQQAQRRGLPPRDGLRIVSGSVAPEIPTPVDPAAGIFDSLVAGLAAQHEHEAEVEREREREQRIADLEDENATLRGEVRDLNRRLHLAESEADERVEAVRRDLEAKLQDAEHRLLGQARLNVAGRTLSTILPT